jgi:muramoyltetrapeptide carboxypeptidase
MSVKPGLAVPIKPRALRPRDTIGIIAPAGAVDAEALQAGCKRLNELGYATVYLDSITERDQYFAGSGKRRLAEFREMMARPDVTAVICARGGYGCNYLLPGLDADTLRRNPKLFIGYSDVTTIITWMVDNGLVALHGPMVAKDFARGSADLESFRSVVGGAALNLSFGEEDGVSVLREGAAEGVLYGGCLSLLVQSLGTPYEVQTNGKLLFVEDVSVHPYQVDRMLMHLRLAGKLDGVRGFIFGPFAGTEPDEEACLRDAILRTLNGFDVPIVFGVPSGHVERGNITLPMGVNATLTAADTVELKCEAAAKV